MDVEVRKKTIKIMKSKKVFREEISKRMSAANKEKVWKAAHKRLYKMYIEHRDLPKGVSMHTKMFANILEVRMLPSEYDVAMKLASMRPYKYDMSDAVGIIKSENITRELIEKAVVNFYESFENLSHPEEARKLLDSIFSADNLEELYDSTRSSESDNRVILKDIDDNYPKLLNEGNLASVLEAAKRKRVRESKE